MTIRSMLFGLFIFALGFFIAACLALAIVKGSISIPVAVRVMPAVVTSSLNFPAASVAGAFPEAA